MEIEPTEIHQRTPLVVGGKSEMEAFDQFVRPTQVISSLAG
jgi:fructose-1,6-bisphosphatase